MVHGCRGYTVVVAFELKMHMPVPVYFPDAGVSTKHWQPVMLAVALPPSYLKSEASRQNSDDTSMVPSLTHVVMSMNFPVRGEGGVGV